MVEEVKLRQPILSCELGSPARTVNVVLRRKTPCFAHRDKFPFSLLHLIFKSSSISLNIFLKDGGTFTPSFTAKASPIA